MTICPLSLAILPDSKSHDAAAARRLFGGDRIPTVDLDMAKLHTVGLAMVGVTSLSGVQRKLSLGLDSARMTLRLQTEGRQFIVVPPTDRFAGLPANEHVTMRIAARCGLQVPEHGLLQLGDGTLAYIVARFDRPVAGGKLAVEDFCALSERYPAEKYRGSAELCARVVRRFASEPGIALRDLFRQFLFAWWTGNGDLHLKNLSLWTDGTGKVGLSPAYDLLNTRLFLPDDELALSICGHKKELTPRMWGEFGAYCGLPTRAIASVAGGLLAALPDACALVERSFLVEAQQQAYVELLNKRTLLLAELAHR